MGQRRCNLRHIVIPKSWDRGMEWSPARIRALDQAWESVSPERKKRFFASLSPGGKAEDLGSSRQRDGRNTSPSRRTAIRVPLRRALRPTHAQWHD
jgi:hypothetical protein